MIATIRLTIDGIYSASFVLIGTHQHWVCACAQSVDWHHKITEALLWHRSPRTYPREIGAVAQLRLTQLQVHLLQLQADYLRVGLRKSTIHRIQITCRCVWSYPPASLSLISVSTTMTSVTLSSDMNLNSLRLCSLCFLKDIPPDACSVPFNDSAVASTL